MHRSNRAGGFIALAGSATLATAAVFPWITTTGPHLTFTSFFDTKPVVVASGGISGGAAGEVLLIAALAAICALIMIGTRRSWGMLWRGVLIMVGGAVATYGGYLIYTARTMISSTVPDSTNPLWHALHEVATGAISTVITVEPGLGAYTMTVGGALAALGGFIPGTIVYSAAPWVSTEAPVQSSYAFQRNQPSVGHSPHSPGSSIVQESEGNESPPPGSIFGPRSRVAIGTLGALVAVFILIASLNSGKATTQGSAQPSIETPSATPTVDACASNAVRLEAGLIDSILGRREDPDTVARVARQIAAVNVASCPAEFISAHQRWVLSWLAYSDFTKEASSFHAPWDSDWSSESVKAKRQPLQSDIKSASEDLAAEAAKVGVDMQTIYWTSPT